MFHEIVQRNWSSSSFQLTHFSKAHLCYYHCRYQHLCALCSSLVATFLNYKKDCLTLALCLFFVIEELFKIILISSLKGTQRNCRLLLEQVLCGDWISISTFLNWSHFCPCAYGDLESSVGREAWHEGTFLVFFQFCISMLKVNKFMFWCSKKRKDLKS